MLEIDENFEITSEPNVIHLQTNSATDTISIAGVNLTQSQAATLAYLINGEDTLKIEIKVDD